MSLEILIITYIITIGTDNRPGGVEGEFHLQFKPDIMKKNFSFFNGDTEI